MQLSYRGIAYQTEVRSIEICETETLGKYRGVTTKISTSSISTPTTSVIALQYRGSSYPHLY